MIKIEVLTAGPAASIQDQGREGCAHMGITRSGAVDPFAWRLGQQLVGNTPPSAVFELALGGLSLRADAPMTVAVTGALAPISIDGAPCEHNRSLQMAAMAVLKLGYTSRGNYSYVAIAGEPMIDRQFGSLSTTVREGLGVFEGRQLRAGDVIPWRLPRAPTPTRFCSRPEPMQKDVLVLRYLPGFQARSCARAISGLESQTFQTTTNANRMGVRLSGTALAIDLPPLWSEAACFGAIQVPPDGQPIVLLNEYQTMGGYPKLGAVLSSDCVRLAQAPTGQKLQFVPITPAEADRILWLERSYEAEYVVTEHAR